MQIGSNSFKKLISQRFTALNTILLRPSELTEFSPNPMTIPTKSAAKKINKDGNRKENLSKNLSIV